MQLDSSVDVKMKRKMHRFIHKIREIYREFSLFMVLDSVRT